ncbi:uncharacterized protein LOC143626528 [Bidens hawaiensis]|uniref:uncharacterized protein LOC143626528 n=1 Tax=Bidens hawaiensis TaxID=980011 RepID=UPI00404ABE3C
MTANGPVLKVSLIMLEDEKAHGYLNMCLSTEITKTIKEYTATKAIWDALVEFEGNLDMREIRKEMLNGEFNMFNHIQGETVTSLINRFESSNTKMRSAGLIHEMSEINKKLLNSLPYTWNSNVTTHQENHESEHNNSPRVNLHHQIIRDG